MRQKIKQGISHPLISGSFIVGLGSTVGNIFNYFFHLSMGRQLTPANYGTLTSLVSIISIFGILSLTIATVVSKFISTYRATESWDDITHMLRGVYKRVALLVLVGFAVYFIFRQPLLVFLHLQDSLLLDITIIGALISLLGTINIGAIQGLLMFKILALFHSGNSLLRLLLSITLVAAGFGVRGAVLGFFLSYAIPYSLSLIPLKKYLVYKESHKQLNFGKVLRYSFPTLIALGGLTTFISIDVILVKHFFSDITVGRYAALSVIGRAIFFGTASVNLVMFPIIAAKFAKKENYNSTFILSLLLVLGIALSATTIYFIFPETLIKLFYSNVSYLKESRNLGLMGVFFTLYSLAQLFINFFLSISKTKIGIFSILASFLQIVLIWNFHSSIREVVLSSIAASGLLVGVLVLYYIYHVLSKD